MKIGFDVISDLNLGPDDEFDWEGKPTSLYLIIAGNISADVKVIHQTLLHLSKLYQGVFYISGSIEHDSLHFIKNRNHQISKICRSIQNVAYLHHHVVIVNGIAIMGCNGWYGNRTTELDPLEELHNHAQNLEDVDYLYGSIERLQLHLDVQKICIVTGSVPGPGLFFGIEPNNLQNYDMPQKALIADSEKKISHWIFGNSNQFVDTDIDNIKYVNNASHGKRPYWPYRIEI
jgi:hypothetical protein